MGGIPVTLSWIKIDSSVQVVLLPTQPYS